MGTNQRYSGRVAVITHYRKIIYHLGLCLSHLKQMNELYEGQDPKYCKFLEDFAGLLVVAQQTLEQFRSEMV